jgi:hypothetical protein
MMDNNPPLVQTLDGISLPPWGEVTRLKVATADYRRLSWLQVWQAFQDVCPGRWALELYPPAEELVDDAHIYHLWLLPEGWRPPEGMNLATRVQVDGWQEQGAGRQAAQVSRKDRLDAWRQALKRLAETGELLQRVAVFRERFEYSDYRAIWDLQRPYIYVTEGLYQELLRRLQAEACDFFLYEGKLFTVGNAVGGYALMPLVAEREAYYLNRRQKMG